MLSEPNRPTHVGDTVKNETALELRLLEAVNHGIVATNTKGEVTFWNRFSEQLTGFPPSAVVGRSILDLVFLPPDDRQILQLQFQEGGSWQGDCQFRPCKVGLSSIPVRLSISPLRDYSGVLSGSVVSFHDLSNRNAIVQKMAIALAHEINQPLGAISNFVGGLICGLEKSNSKDSKDEELCHTLKLIHSEAIRASQIVSRLRKSTSKD